MAINYIGNLIGANSWSFTDALINPANNTFIGVESTTPQLRVFNMSTLTQISSSVIQSNPRALTLINTASAVSISSNSNTVDFIELSSMYRTSQTGTFTGVNYTKYQQLAADPAAGIAFGCTGTTGTLVKITATGQTISTIQLKSDQYQAYTTCVIYKQPGRFLVGYLQGNIYEIDVNGNIVDSFRMNIGTGPNSIDGAYSNVTPIYPAVWYMAYDNNLLLVGSDSCLFTIDWSTKTVIKTIQCQGNTGTGQTMISTAASGEVIYANQLSLSGAGNAIIQEIDFTTSPTQTQSELYSNSTAVYNLLGIGASGYGFAQQSSSLGTQIFQIVPRGSTTRTIQVNPGGVDQKFRLILVDDTGGTGTSKVILDTLAQSPATYRVPTGKTLKEIVKVGNGTTATWDMSSYST